MNRPLHPVPRPAAALALAAALLALVGCATPPTTRLHSLLPATTLQPADAAPPLALTIAPLRLPASVDQAPWLVRLPDDTLLQLEHERWASPLRDELRGALRETLARRWGALDSPGTPPAWRLTLELTRFESVAGQEARLEARWALTPLAAASSGPAAAPPACQAVLREAVAGGAPALAEGHRRAVARLADRIGRQLRTAARGEAAPCESDAP